MRIILVVWALLVSSLIYAFSNNTELGLLEKCTDPVCDLVAKKIKSIDLPPVNDGITVDFDNRFRLAIPKPVRIAHDAKGLVFIYGNKKALTVETEEIPLEYSDNTRQLSDNQLPEIIFLKTSKDKEPESPIDKNIWRFGLHLKDSDQITGLKNAFYFTKGTSTIYFSTKLKEVSGIAYVTDENQKMNYLKIQAVNFEDNIFKRIIGNITIHSK